MATCDQLSPKIFKKEPEKLLPYIYTWIKSDKVYTVRFAIGTLMQHFLDERFDSKYADSIQEQCIAHKIHFEFRQCGTHFIKDGKSYTLSTCDLCSQARKANINY